MIVVVGGQARKCGKTQAVCDIISATRHAGWTAVKITTHRHSPSPRGDTERYIEAGARQSLLVHSTRELPEAQNLIVESNAAVEEIRADLFVFVTDPALQEWKASALRVASRADFLVDGRVDDTVIATVSERLGAGGQYPRRPTADN